MITIEAESKPDSLPGIRNQLNQSFGGKKAFAKKSTTHGLRDLWNSERISLIVTEESEPNFNDHRVKDVDVGGYDVDDSRRKKGNTKKRGIKL